MHRAWEFVALIFISIYFLKDFFPYVGVIFTVCRYFCRKFVCIFDVVFVSKVFGLEREESV